MTKSFPANTCTTDGRPHEYRFQHIYRQIGGGSVYVTKCRVCGDEQHRPSVNRRDLDMTDREVAA